MSDYLESGYDVFLQKEPLVQQQGQKELTELEFDLLNENVSNSKLSTGLQKSTNGVLSIDWNTGLITINFPTGYLKIGNIDGQIFGLIQNDGNVDNILLGFQKDGFEG